MVAWVLLRVLRRRCCDSYRPDRWQTGGRGGKKPFRYATEKPDSTDRAVEEVLEGRPEAPDIPPKPVPPVPIHPSDGVFVEKDWEG